MDLKEWTLTYVKNKDLLQKKIQNQAEKGNILTFQYKDKTHEYVIHEQLSECTKHKTSASHLTFVCPATQTNLEYVLKNWKELVQQKNLNFLFVNLQSNDKMILQPSTHNLIADEETLELGLRSMFSQVAGLPLPPEPKRRKKELSEETSKEAPKEEE